MRVLVIQRDNIGDMVCTTPLLAGIRDQFPDAWIAVLANSYNVAVLAGNSDVDAIYVQHKLKHHGIALLPQIAMERLRLPLELRRMNLDYVLITNPASPRRMRASLAAAKPKRIVGFVAAGSDSVALDIALPVDPGVPRHAVEQSWRLGEPLGLKGEPPSAKVIVSEEERLRARERIERAGFAPYPLLIGLHISARKPSQRWPAEKFVALARRLHKRYGAAFLLFWAPGDADDPRHPGDDSKSLAIATALGDFPVLPWPTDELRSLVSGVACCDAIVCSDGGAMHLAAGLGKPIVCLFGDSDAATWHPWRTRYQLLQPSSRDVTDVSVDEALIAVEHLSVHR